MEYFREGGLYMSALKRGVLLNRGSGLKTGSGLSKGAKPLKKGAKKRRSKGDLEEDWKFYREEIWDKREHICVSCGCNLGYEMLSINIEHALEKDIYPQYRKCRGNLFLVCGDCHHRKGNGFPTEKYKKILDKVFELHLLGELN